MLDIAAVTEGYTERSWFDESNAAEQSLSQATRPSKLEVREALIKAGCVQWALLPGSEPGDSRRFLMVLVDDGLGHNTSDKSIQDIFERRLDQTRIYVNRISPSTEGVLFVLARSHFTWGLGWRSPAHLYWRQAWCRYRTFLKQDRPELHLRVSFLDRIREGGRSCHLDRDGAPVGGRQLLDWWEQAGSADRDLLCQRIRLLRHLGVEPDLDCRFYEAIGSNQPEGCNFSPCLDFGATFRERGNEQRLVARLYLNTELDLPVAFPASRYNEESRMGIITGSDDGSAEELLWRPNDMAVFARDPQLWLARNSALL